MSTRLHLHLYGNRGIAAEGVYYLNASSVFSRLMISITGIADGFEGAVFAGTVVLPVVGKGFAGLPVKIYCPEINKIKAAFNSSFLDRFQFFGGYFGERGEKLGEFDVYGFALVFLVR
jgi:hypothetical protein